MFEPLHTNRLILKRLASSDAKAMFAYRSLPEVKKYQTWEPASKHEIRQFIDELPETGQLEPGKWFQVGIFEQKTGQLIGDCGMFMAELKSRQIEIGITIHPDFQRRGFAAEALKAVIDYLFNQSGMHRIYASVDPRNTASIALFKSVGFRKEAHFIKSFWFKGQWVDDVVFGLLKQEWSDSDNSLNKN